MCRLVDGHFLFGAKTGQILIFTDVSWNKCLPKGSNNVDFE